MIARLCALLAACAAAACATTYDAAADNVQWFYSTEDGEAKLVYGVPESDNIAIMLDCRPGSGRVGAYRGGLGPGEGIVLASGGRSVTLHGESGKDELSDGVYVDAETPSSTGVLQDFRRSGRISVNGEALHATPAERAQIEQFFATCG
jgi:hypothetical protein